MNKNAICFLTNNRPKYFSDCVDYTIQCNNISKYDIVSGEEPPSTSLNEMFEKLSKYFNIHRNINKKRKLITRNLKDMLDFSFSKYERSIVVEEDLLLSKDALDFCDEMLTEFENDEKCFGVCLFRNNIAMPDILDFNKYGKMKYFVPLGWATWKNRWNVLSEKLLNVQTSNDNVPYFNLSNWDSKTLQYINDNDMYCVFPLISRTSHIGYYGMHTIYYSKEWHDDHVKSPYWCERLGLSCNQWEFKETEYEIK